MVEEAPVLPARTNLGRRDWLLIVIALPIIATLALGEHDILDNYGVPYPRWQLPLWVTAIGQASKIGGALLLYYCADHYFRRRSLLSAVLTLGFLFVFLQETLRVILIELTITEGWADGSWPYTLVDHIPDVLPLTYALFAVPIGRFSPRGKPALALFLVCAAGALVAYVISPALKEIPPAIIAHFSLIEPRELHKAPYDWFTYRVIYPTFIEATIACFCLAILVWPRLRGGEGMKIAQFTGLILLTRGRVAGLVLNTLWLKQMSYPMALVSFGQFFVETVIMASLTGLVWSRICSRKTNQQADQPLF